MIASIVAIVICVLMILLLMFIGQRLSGEMRTVGIFVCICIGIYAGHQLYKGIIQKQLNLEQNKKCLERMEDIMAAIEKYNENSPKLMEKLDLGKLQKKNLLTKPITPTENDKFECVYSGQKLDTTEGKIVCTVHGDIDQVRLEIAKQE